MITKLTVKTWLSTGVIILICFGLAVPMLWKYGPSAVEALGGLVPELAKTESMSNIYGISGLGLVFVLFGLLIFVRQLTNSVRKRVKKYLAENQGVTLEQLNNDFAAAEEIGNVWIGRRWTFSHDLRCILVENAKIVWMYSETERVRNKVNYYLCLALVDGTVEMARVSEKRLSRMKEVYGRFPHILVGNNPEYGYLFKNDKEAFLDMKYRQKAE